MNKKITSLWQDYETHQFTCEHCKTQYLGNDLVHDFDASELVLPLNCPNCERRVALLNIQASEEQIRDFAAQGYQTAIDHLVQPKTDLINPCGLQITVTANPDQVIQTRFHFGNQRWKVFASLFTTHLQFLTSKQCVRAAQRQASVVSARMAR